jgi:hypothetical protein
MPPSSDPTTQNAHTRSTSNGSLLRQSGLSSLALDDQKPQYSDPLPEKRFGKPSGTAFDKETSDLYAGSGLKGKALSREIKLKSLQPHESIAKTDLRPAIPSKLTLMKSPIQTQKSCIG